jgi:hypothetical protein
MSKVNVSYSDFNSNEIEKIGMSLFNNILFEAIVKDGVNGIVTLSMKDKISSNVELAGEIDYDALNSLLKALSTIKKQLGRNG